MHRKPMLAGLTVVLMLTALMAVSQCRAGLFDGLFRKNHFKKSKLERRPPCAGCTFGFHRTTWRPWATCCETAQSSHSRSPWSGDNDVFPAPGPYDSSPSFGTTPGPYEMLPNRAPVDNDYQFTTPESDQLLIPDEPPNGPSAPSGLPPFRPFDGTPLDSTSEEPVPTLTPQPADSPTRPAADAPDDLTSPDSLLLPESTRPAVPLPAPSTVPPVPGVGPQAGRQSWQPISYSNSRDRRYPQTRPQQTRSQSSEWRVMPGFYGPQQTTRPVDRTMFVPPPRR